LFVISISRRILSLNTIKVKSAVRKRTARIAKWIMKRSLKSREAYGRMRETATAGMTQAAIQYLRAWLLFVDRMKIKSNVIRRTPTHWMARPTFESINWDLV
jgi:hypothetical protein